MLNGKDFLKSRVVSKPVLPIGAGHGITRDGEIPFERREIGRVFECRREQQRSEHDQERERKQRHRGDQHIANRLEPQQEPIARLDRKAHV